MNNSLPAINGYLVNKSGEILLLKESGGHLWLALSGLIKDLEPVVALKNKAQKELSLQINDALFFDAGLVDNILMNRYLVTDYSGELKLGNKYEKFRWVPLEKVAETEDVCPYVKSAVNKILKIMMTIKPGIYKHYKGGEYKVLTEAKNSETKEVEIVYQDTSDESKVWVRSKAMFLEEVETDGEAKPRFEFIKESEEDNWEHQYKLALADYQNLLKKTAADKTEFAKYAIADLLEDIIPVYDHLKLSLLGLSTEEENNAWAQGVKYVLKQFKDVLEARGVEEIKTVGEKFDHNTMEALEGEGEIVTKEIMPGYRLNGRLIRAAKVAV
ncbi:MAG: nucleotide exchange factor GrpE [Patescibacteria group bacterium]